MGKEEPVEASELTLHAHLETAAPNAWFNHQTYVDVLNSAAIACFIRETHERYRETVGHHFGKGIPGILTDEPQTIRRERLACAESMKDLNFPWTSDLPDSYRAAFGEEILDTLPELVWERADGAASPARWRYHDHLAERLASACGSSCRVRMVERPSRRARREGHPPLRRSGGAGGNDHPRAASSQTRGCARRNGGLTFVRATDIYIANNKVTIPSCLPGFASCPPGWFTPPPHGKTRL
jgi:hypothetical protein